MKSPNVILIGNISNREILMELTNTKTQIELLEKLVSVYEKRGIKQGTKDLLNILKGSFSFVLPFGKGKLFYCDFYGQNRFCKNPLCNDKCSGIIVYIEGTKCEKLDIFYPVMKGYNPELIY